MSTPRFYVFAMRTDRPGSGRVPCPTDSLPEAQQTAREWSLDGSESQIVGRSGHTIMTYQNGETHAYPYVYWPGLYPELFPGVAR